MSDSSKKDPKKTELFSAPKRNGIDPQGTCTDAEKTIKKRTVFVDSDHPGAQSQRPEDSLQRTQRSLTPPPANQIATPLPSDAPHTSGEPEDSVIRDHFASTQAIFPPPMQLSLEDPSRSTDLELTDAFASHHKPTLKSFPATPLPAHLSEKRTLHEFQAVNPNPESHEDSEGQGAENKEASVALTEVEEIHTNVVRIKSIRLSGSQNISPGSLKQQPSDSLGSQRPSEGSSNRHDSEDENAAVPKGSMDGTSPLSWNGRERRSAQRISLTIESSSEERTGKSEMVNGVGSPHQDGLQPHMQDAAPENGQRNLAGEYFRSSKDEVLPNGDPESSGMDGHPEGATQQKHREKSTPSAVAPSQTGRTIRSLTRTRVVMGSAIGLLGTLLLYFSFVFGQQENEAQDSKSQTTRPLIAAPSQAEEMASSVILVESNPPGAEIVHNGAVIGNTPLKVKLPAFEQLYMLRLSGHQPELIRISPASTESIRVALKPLEESPSVP